MEITPRILTSFLVLAEEKHFRHAAERLFITGPALSQQIRQLEDGLKVRLFDRTSRSVELTAWAQRASRDRRVLRVGFMSTGAGETTQHLLTAARDRLPDLDVQLHYLDWGDQLGPVQRGEVDLALVREPEPPSSLHTMPVLEESRVVLLPADHPLAGRESVRFDEIAGEVFLPSATGSQEWKDYWLVVPRPDGSEPVLGPATRSVEDMLEYVAAGRGISLTARAVSLFYAHPGVRFVPVADLPATRVLLVRAAESPHPDVLRFESLVRSLRDR